MTQNKKKKIKDVVSKSHKLERGKENSQNVNYTHWSAFGSKKRKNQKSDPH